MYANNINDDGKRQKICTERFGETKWKTKRNNMVTKKFISLSSFIYTVNCTERRSLCGLPKTNKNKPKKMMWNICSTHTLSEMRLKKRQRKKCK